MAPELFLGAKPSIKTDLFSLGVTLFNFLTHEHPYFGPDTNGRYSTKLRHTVLANFLSKRGPKLSSLTKLIFQCLSLDPQKRPESYQATGWVVGESERQAEPEKEPLPVLRAAIARAVFFTETGDIENAEIILRDQIKKSPEDPIALNALAVLLLKCDKRSNALNIFTSAYEILCQTNGIWHGSLYLDPAINLASQLIASESYNLASNILKTTWKWVEKSSNNNARSLQFSPNPDGWYCEFGWMFLYTGDFVKASEYLAKTLSRKGLDKRSNYWLAESAWLGNCMPEYADFLVRGLLEFAPSEPAAALCGCLAAQFSTKELAHKMITALSANCRKEISAAEKSAGLERDALLYPKAIDSQKLIIRSIDAMITGGVHHGLV
jgi:serine/threonine protein kinase